MIDSHTINIEGIGQIILKYSKRVKHVNISVKPYSGVQVAVPYGVSFKKAEEFVHMKTEWIQRHLDKISRYEEERSAVQDSFNDIDEAEARRMLTSRLIQLAEKHSFTYNRVSIRNQRTRWGSCSHKNNISLNMKLIKLPDELIDYVILHELVHTRKKDHSKAFWVELDELVGNGKIMASRLRSYGLGLY